MALSSSSDPYSRLKNKDISLIVPLYKPNITRHSLDTLKICRYNTYNL